MSSIRITAVLMAVLGADQVCAQTSPAIVPRAVSLAKKQPDTQRLIGLAEIQRAHGDKQAGLDGLTKAAKVKPKRTWLVSCQ